MFPNEILVMIGQHLEPGTRTLTNLARSCSALYRMLVPHLYSSVDLKCLLRKPGAARNLSCEMGSGFSRTAELDISLDRE